MVTDNLLLQRSILLGLDQIIINDPVHENFKSVNKREEDAVRRWSSLPPYLLPYNATEPSLSGSPDRPAVAVHAETAGVAEQGARRKDCTTRHLKVAHSFLQVQQLRHTWVAIAQLMRMRNLFKHSDELSSSSVMCIESKMEAQSRYSYLARVEKELKALHKAQESVLVLNYYNLREFPDVLLCDEHCRKRLRKLYLKRNLITSLVQSVN